MALFAFAPCFTPIINKPMSIRMMADAGKLIMPPSIGALVSDSGKGMPIAVSALLKYPDQPLATAATEIPYSSNKSQPIIKAITSPNAA